MKDEETFITLPPVTFTINLYECKVRFSLQCTLLWSKFIVLQHWPHDRTVIMIVNYNRKTFIVQATGLSSQIDYISIERLTDD